MNFTCGPSPLLSAEENGFSVAASIPAGLKLLDCKVSKTGVIIAIYSRDGMIKTGSVALEVPTEAEIERRKRLKEEK